MEKNRTRCKNPDPIYAVLGQLMVGIRKSRKMSQADVAKALGVVESAVTHYELANNRVVLSSFVHWCRALDVDPGVVLQTAVTLTYGDKEKQA